MLKKSVCALVLALAACGPARADKLIWTPTAEVARLRAEYMKEAGEDLSVITAQIGIAQIELLGRRYQDLPDDDDATEVGGQIQILPEGFATPAISAGIWDVADKSPRGRRAFVVATKTVPIINWLPLWVKNVKIHGGLGTGDLSGLFFGAQASIPLGLTLAAEFDSDETNFGLWWQPTALLRLKAESWGGDTFFGLQFVSPL